MTASAIGAHKSYLSQAKYGYDLVVATTQSAVNATMKAFLSSYDGNEFTACYKYDGTTNSYVGIDYQAVVQALGGADPFAIPDKTAGSDPKITALDDLGFEFAFRAKLGVPDGVAPADIPDIIVLDEGNTIVSYQMFCAEFQVLILEEHHHQVSWTNLSQPANAPWIFRFNVNLDMRTGDQNAFDNLPESVKNKVKNLNPDSAFSVQQLYLDLNTAGLQNSPDIVGIDKSSDAYVYLTRIFLNTYWDTVRKSGGDVLLGYAVKPVTPNTRTPSLIPTDLTIEVSPNVDATGNATKNYGLYSLAFLVMSNNDVLPAPVPFEWNWVDATEKADFHGSMAVNKNRFADYLNRLMSPALNRICLIPTCNMSIPNPVQCKWTVSYKPDPAPQTYRMVNDSTSRVLTFSYSKSDHSSDTFVPLWGNISLGCATQSDVYFEDNIIRAVTQFTGSAHINIEGGVTDGEFVKYKVETKYQINVDTFGNLVVTMAPGSPALTDLSATPHPDGWSKFVTLGDIDSMVSKLKGFLTGIQSVLSGHDQAILQILNGASSWVFPGGKTFTYKAAYFSEHQDLITHVLYVDPS